MPFCSLPGIGVFNCLKSPSGSFLCDGPEWITEGSSYYLCRAFRITPPPINARNFTPSVDFLCTYIEPVTALLPTSVLSRLGFFMCLIQLRLQASISLNKDIITHSFFKYVVRKVAWIPSEYPA